MDIRVVLKFGLAALVTAALVLPLTSAGAVSSAPPGLTRVSIDTIADGVGLHQSESQSSLASAKGSKTLVSAFEVGRIFDGGSSAIGWATSVNGGKSFKHGLVPATIAAGGPSTNWRAADPAVAYNDRYGKWLVVYRTLGSTGNVLALDVSRSTDGKSWSAPIDAHLAAAGDTPSKPWIGCDNAPASAGYGNCYVSYTNTGSTPANQLQLLRSTDGGATWSSPAAPSDASVGTGTLVLVQPPAPSSNGCGRVVVPFVNGSTVNAVFSTDCGASWSARSVVTSTQAATHTVAQGLRSALLPTASMDGAGAIYLAWQTRSFRITQTTLAAAASAGDTNIKVASVTGMTVGNTLTVDVGGAAETVTITTVGTAGSGGTGITVTPALAFAHAAGSFVTVNGVASTSTATPNDIALAVMPAPTDATPAPSFGAPARIPIESDAGAATNTVDHFIPAIAADPNTSGGSAHLGLFYYFYPRAACNFINPTGPQCTPQYGYVSSTDGGSSWTSPSMLAGMPSLAVLPRSANGPDLGGYTSAAVIPTGPLAGNAISVFAYAGTVGGIEQSMYVPTHGLAIGGGS